MATNTTSSEMMNPCSMGFAPDLHNLAKLVFSPMAARAHTIKNLLTVLNTLATSAGTSPRLRSPERARKPRMNQGNTDRIRTCTVPAPAAFFFKCMLMAANTSTVGMIARVRVSFTMAAKSPAASLKA